MKQMTITNKLLDWITRHYYTWCFFIPLAMLLYLLIALVNFINDLLLNTLDGIKKALDALRNNVSLIKISFSVKRYKSARKYIEEHIIK